jgi:nanoRNase/pAp phosphatase (c-di-AMP/oligoRNAs hydrolase)
MINNSTLISFINKLSLLPRIILQAYDFPDHDAVASTYAMSILLKKQAIESVIVYNEGIDRISLSNMIEWINISIIHCSEAQLTANDKIITIDGCIGETNVTDMLGEEIAVIDHHAVTPPENLWFSDIRENYGTTATIIFEYFELLNIKIPTKIATARLIGLNIDTAHLTRGFCAADIKASIVFNEYADLALVNKICRNEITYAELKLYEQACQNTVVTEGIAVVTISIACPKNMLGIIRDFVLAVNEIDIVIVAQHKNSGIQLSLRSECEHIDVAKILREELNIKKLGFGGGHSHIAGGVIFSEHVRAFKDEDSLHLSPIIDSIIDVIRLKLKH